MITVDERPSAVTASEGPNLLHPKRARYIALGAIADGVTPGELRLAAAERSSRVGRQIADEAEYLIAHGVTGRVAVRAQGEIARLSVRRVAAAMLHQEGPAAIGICRQIADTAGQDGDAVLRCSFLEFAAEAELLLAEGFDPAASAA